MNSEILTDYQQFCKLKNEWNVLLKQSKSNSIFLTWEWLDSWLRAYQTTEKPYVILFRNKKQELIGIAPFVINDIKGGFFLKYRALYFWGLTKGVKESEYLDIIAKSGLEDAVCRKVFEVLISKSRDWDILLYHEVPESSVCIRIFRKLIEKYRWPSVETSHGCSVINLPETYDDYIKSLKPRMRTKLRSLPKRMRKGYSVELEVLQNHDKLEKTLASFIELHQKKWKAEGHLGVFTDQKRRDFYQFISNAFVGNQWLIIFSLKVDGVYRAHEFGFVYNNKLFVIQEGYDTDWEKNGIGNVLRTFVLQYCIDNSLDEYDFLGGVTYHKDSWGVFIKNSISITIGRRCLKTMLYLYTPTVIEGFKSIYRIVVPRKLVQWRINLANARKARKVREAVSGEKRKGKVVINRPVK